MDISIAIGRNIGNAPMSDKQWGRFKMDILNLVLKSGARCECVESGKAEYRGEAEQFYRIWASVDLDDISFITADLPRIAQSYGQWGISVTTGRTRIFRAEEVVSG